MWVEGRSLLVRERLKWLGMYGPFRNLGERCSPLTRVRWVPRMGIHVRIWSVALAVHLQRNLVMEWLLHLLLRRIEVERDRRFDVCHRNRLLRSWLMHGDTHGPMLWRQGRLRDVVRHLWQVDDRRWTVRQQGVLTLIRCRRQAYHWLASLHSPTLIPRYRGTSRGDYPVPLNLPCQG